MAKVEFYPDAAGGRWYFPCPGCKMGHELPVQPMPHDPQKQGWGFNFDTEAPTFTPSILARYDYNREGKPQSVCHCFVTDGAIRFLSDCTHALAGQTVKMADIEQD